MNVIWVALSTRTYKNDEVFHKIKTFNLNDDCAPTTPTAVAAVAAEMLQ